MVNIYNKYLTRALGKRNESPEYAMMSRYLAEQSTTNTELLKRAGGTGYSNNGAAANIAGIREVSRQIGENTNAAFGTAQDAMDQRLANSDANIERLSIARDEEQKRIDAEIQARKNAPLKVGLQVGGAVLGGIAGSVIPGAGTMIGAQIGAGLGGAAAGFVGGGGKVGMKYANYDEIMQGVGDTISGISAASTLSQHKNYIKKAGDFLTGDIYKNMKSDDVLALRDAFLSGDKDLIKLMMRKYELGYKL